MPEQVCLTSQQIEDLMSLGEFRKCRALCHPILSIENAVMERRIEWDRRHFVSMDIQHLCLYVYPRGVSLTAGIISAITTRMVDESTTRPSITNNISSYFQQLSTHPSWNEPDTLERTVKIAPSAAVMERQRDIAQRIKVDDLQVAAAKAISRGLSDPVLPSLSRAVKASTREVLRSGWLFMEFPRPPSSEAFHSPPSSSPTNFGRRHLKRTGWVVWAEVVYLPSVSDRRRRSLGRSRGKTSSWCNALWVYATDSVFDPRPVMVIQPAVTPTETESGFRFITDRYVMFSTTMLSQIVSKTGEDVSSVGRKGKSLQFQFVVSIPHAAAVSFDPNRLTPTPSFSPRSTEARGDGDWRDPSNIVRIQWCRSLSLNVAGFRLQHMKPPEILPRPTLKQHSGNRSQFFVKQAVMILGQKIHPLLQISAFGVAGCHDGKMKAKHIISLYCEDFRVDDLSFPIGSTRRYIVRPDESALKEPVMSRSESEEDIFGTLSESSQSRVLIFPEPGRIHDRMPNAESTSFDLERVVSPEFNSKRTSTFTNKPGLPYWLPLRLFKFIHRWKEPLQRRHFFIEAHWDVDKFKVKIDPIEVLMQPQLAANFSNDVLAVWTELLSMLPSTSSLRNTMLSSPAKGPTVKPTPVGLLQGKLLRSGPLPQFIYLPPLLPVLKIQPAFEAFGVSVSIVLLQSFTGMLLNIMLDCCILPTQYSI